MTTDKKIYQFLGDPEDFCWLYDGFFAVPSCSKHLIELGWYPKNDYNSPYDLACKICKIRIHNEIDNFTDLKSFGKQRIEAQSLKDLQRIFIDEEGSAVLAREKIEKDPNYFVDAKLSNTSRGLQLMVIAGRKDENGKKVQLFVEPGRMSFDHNRKDQHPTGLFAKVEATFKDSKTSIDDV
jgi:hypothetical protein